MARARIGRLLLATEGTPQDAGAERTALALAAALDAPLTVVLPFATNEELLGVAPDVALKMEAAAGTALRRLSTTAAGAGVRAETVVWRGSSVAENIVAAAAAHEADLLVTRRVGRRGLLARLLVGEMVSQVAARVGRLMLMVPEKATGLWTGHVVVPQATATEAALASAGALADAAGVAIVKPEGDLSQAIAPLTAADLVVIALRRPDIASGRLSAALETAIGAAPCASLLVPTGADVAGRA